METMCLLQCMVVTLTLVFKMLLPKQVAMYIKEIR